VQQAIDRAREKLRQTFPFDNTLKNRLLQEAGTP
jgi:hypothetical protein